MNLADIFEALADTLGDREALVFEGRTLTFAQLDREATRLAHALHSAGAQHGDHVSTHMRNSHVHVATLLGALKARMVPVNINYRYTEGELAYLYSNSDSTMIVVDEEFTPVVAQA